MSIKRTISIENKKQGLRKRREEPKFNRKPNPQGKHLVVVESPAKAKTIEKILGSKYKVMASMGHLRDLPQNSLGVDIEHGFDPHYVNVPNRKQVIEELRAEANRSKDVLLATDPDREGEAISFHLAHLLDVPADQAVRITFHEITPNAIMKAVTNPRSVNIAQVNAQQARRVLDRVVGYKLSPLLWKKIFRGLSAGRVQSVAVRLICEREEEIQAFEPKEYWSIETKYATTAGDYLVAKLYTYRGQPVEIGNEDRAHFVEKDLKKLNAIVTQVKHSQKRRKPQAPFTTSTLQQDSVNRLNFAARKTMMIAQQLYEGLDIRGAHVGLITYMRTDSTRIAAEIQTEARAYIEKKFGTDFVPETPNYYSGQSQSQDAHEAIRPTSLQHHPDDVAPFLTKDQLKLYTLIWNRFLASQMTPQVSKSVTAVIEAGEYGLRAVGSQIVFPGFSIVYASKERSDENLLPNIDKNDVLAQKKVLPKQHFTQPPARYTEATLIKLLEEKGIGRPSTYAPILDTIQKRNYVQKKDKSFVPTELGFIVVGLLKRFFHKIIDVRFTSKMEEELDKIAEGDLTYEELMDEFYQVFIKELQTAESELDKVKLAEEESDVVCEKCGAKMVYKLGRYGRFLACPNFPECKNTKAIVDKIGIPCPKCKKGDVVRRKSKRGRIFYGCSRYPECDLALWNEPVNQFCPICDSIMIKKKNKKRGEEIICSNRACSSKGNKDE